MQKFDVAIVGGGVVGLTLACLLAQQKLSVAVIADQPPPPLGLKTPADSRVNAIHHASHAVFRALDVWESMQQLRVSPYCHMRVWDAGSPAQLEFSASEISQTCLGYIVEYGVMQQVLWQHLQACDTVTLYAETQPQALTEKSLAAVMHFANGDAIAADVVVGADGKNSWVAQQAFPASKAKAVASEYALVTTLHTEQSHVQTALQRFLTTGPVALLPLKDPHQVSLVWSVQDRQIGNLKNLSDTAFNQTLEQACEYALGKLEVCGPRLSFPLLRHQAEHYVKARIALIGDAAHTILPLAGQGLNLGLLDAACLAQVLVEAHGRGRDLGAVTTLRRYERWRKGENTAMLYAMEGFNQLFANSAESIRAARHLGFAITQRLPWVKKYFMERAMGLRGELPEVAKQGAKAGLLLL